jgi:hypothetical protein
VRALLSLLGLINLANGIAMIAAPHFWYESTPGVIASGPMNHHFIVDIGLAFLASGAGMLAGLRQGRTAAILALAGATWPALHAFFHIVEWLTNGFPRDPTVAATEVVGVVFVSFLGLALAALRAREEGAL